MQVRHLAPHWHPLNVPKTLLSPHTILLIHQNYSKAALHNGVQGASIAGPKLALVFAFRSSPAFAIETEGPEANNIICGLFGNSKDKTSTKHRTDTLKPRLVSSTL